MNSRAKRLGILVLGWFFILLGIAGLFLPILQGILFLLIGLILLSTEYVWAHKLLTKVKARFPKIAAHADAAHRKVDSILARWFHREKPAKAED